MAYSIVDVDEVDGVFKRVRRELGVRAFGINYVELPPGEEGHEHDERASAQEEVIFVVAGSGHMRIDGDRVDLKPGRFLRIDPEGTRCPVAGPAGLSFVAVGARQGAYEPPSWE